MTAFRFMHSPATEGDFRPVAIMASPSPKDKCDRFALSFFDSLEAGLRRYISLALRLDARSRYGGHVGEIDLLESDGLASEPNKQGHMDLHPEEGSGFANRVKTYVAATPADTKVGLT